MTALLSEYGLWVLGALLGAGAVLGAAVGEAVRRRRDPLRARGSASGVRVTGRLKASARHGSVVTLITGVDAEGAELGRHTVRCGELWLETPDGDLEVSGAVTVVGAGQRVRPGELQSTLLEHAKAAHPELAWQLEEMPLEVRVLHDGDRVTAMGALTRTPDEAGSYRESASRRVLVGLDADGVRLLRPTRRAALRGAAAGALLAVLAVAGGARAGWETMELLDPTRRHLVVNRILASRPEKIGRRDAEILLHLMNERDSRRARVLSALGRRDEAVAAATRGARGPHDRAEALVSAGLIDEARETLRHTQGREARAHEVVIAARGRWRGTRAATWRRALERVCGERWGCAAHPRLLDTFEPPRPSAAVALSGRLDERALAEALIVHRVTRDATREDDRVATSFARSSLYLSAALAGVGADDEAACVLRAVTPALSAWPGLAGAFARRVETQRHVLAVLRGEALDDPPPSLAPRVSLLRAESLEEAPRGRGLSDWLAWRLDDLRVGRPLPLEPNVHSPSRYLEMASLAHLLPPEERLRVAEWARRARPSGLQSGLDLQREVARERLLGALGEESAAARLGRVLERRRRRDWTLSDLGACAARPGGL